MTTENSRVQMCSVSGGCCGYTVINSLKNACYPVFSTGSGISGGSTDSIGMMFRDCMIQDSGDWGIFLAQDEKDRVVHDVEFTVRQGSNNLYGTILCLEFRSESEESD
jgi:hypothetical protein